MSPSIFIDNDGVVHFWNQCAFKYLQLSPKEIKITQQGLKTNYDFLEDYVGKETVNKVVDTLKEKFWQEIKLFPWAKDLYKMCCKLVGQDNVYFLSSYGKWDAAASVKASRIRKEFNTDHLILTKYKYLLAAPNRLLIDDKPKNVEKFREAGGQGYLFPNEFRILDGEVKISNVFKEIEKVIKDLR